MTKWWHTKSSFCHYEKMSELFKCQNSLNYDILSHNYPIKSRLLQTEIKSKFWDKKSKLWISMSSLWFKYCASSKYHGKLLYHVRVCLILEGPDKTFLYIDFLLLMWVILFHHYSVHSMSVCVQNAFLMYVCCRITMEPTWGFLL